MQAVFSYNNSEREPLHEHQKTEKAPGALVALTKKGLLVACRGGDVVLVRELQAPGGKRMPASDYFRGHPITI